MKKDTQKRATDKKTLKLKVKRETLREISPSLLDDVVGGLHCTTTDCTSVC